ICVIAHSSFPAGLQNSGPQATWGNTGAKGVPGSYNPGGYQSCGTQYLGSSTGCTQDGAAEVDGYYYWGFHNATIPCQPPPPIPCSVNFDCSGNELPPQPNPDGSDCNPCVPGVNPVCTAPQADFVVAKIDPCNNIVHFTDKSISKSGFGISNWYWDFGDGGSSTSQNPSHDYGPLGGEFDVQLTVMDGNGMTDTKIIHVSVPANTDCTKADPKPGIDQGGCFSGCAPHSGTNKNLALKDSDGDGIPDGLDNCPYASNAKQVDTFHSGLGDACNPDIDMDGIPNLIDNCPTTPNKDQSDLDGDGIGDACDPDIDGDGICNPVSYAFHTSTARKHCIASDNCPTVYNPDQKSTNGNGVGDACSKLLVDQSGAGGLTNTNNHQSSLTRGLASLVAPQKDCIGPVCMSLLGWMGTGLLVVLSASLVAVGVLRRRSR
ncbi:MAG: thrombospondin type 3 repeat-containing protein, partial [Thermoplasmatota archaeon]